jgi:hypothetical protein
MSTGPTRSQQTVIHKLAITGAITALVLAAGAVAYRESRRQERDRRAILAHVAMMEKAIRARDQSIWMHVEENDVRERPDPAREAVHQQMLRDFARLSRLQRFAMTDVRVEISGDAAVARYRIEGMPHAADTHPSLRELPDPPAPAEGEVGFTRAADGWEMTSHRLIEQR